MSKRTLIAVACADLHLSLQAPACRAEKDWSQVQMGYLQELNSLAKMRGVPILCAGDIFDRWNPTPELINFALEHLPNDMICIPGQHDLPHHRMDLMHRSGYGVLKRVKKIRDIAGTSTGNLGGFDVRGFGWDQQLEPTKKLDRFLRIALVHRYVWVNGKGFPGAPKEALAGTLQKSLRGYDVAVFGDNHQRFKAKVGQCTLWNCGGFIRRKSDEQSYLPAVGMIYSDGSTEPYFLNVEGDCFHAAGAGATATPADLREFIAGLESLGEHGENFAEVVKNYLRQPDLSPGVKRVIQSCLPET